MEYRIRCLPCQRQQRASCCPVTSRQHCDTSENDKKMLKAKLDTKCTHTLHYLGYLQYMNGAVSYSISKQSLYSWGWETKNDPVSHVTCVLVGCLTHIQNSKSRKQNNVSELKYSIIKILAVFCTKYSGSCINSKWFIKDILNRVNS